MRLIGPTKRTRLTQHAFKQPQMPDWQVPLMIAGMHTSSAMQAVPTCQAVLLLLLYDMATCVKPWYNLTSHSLIAATPLLPRPPDKLARLLGDIGCCCWLLPVLLLLPLLLLLRCAALLSAALRTVLMWL